MGIVRAVCQDDLEVPDDIEDTPEVPVKVAAQVVEED
jgi:hypothetical protein